MPRMQADPERHPGPSPGFRDGLAAPWEGFSHLRRHPALWRYAVAPIVFNVLLTVLLCALAVAGVVAFAAWWETLAPGTGAWRVAEGILLVLIAVASLGALAASWFLLQAALCGFFYARLARAVERQLGARPEDLHELPVRREIVDGVRAFLRFAAVNLALLALNLVPVVGSAAALVGGAYFDAWFFGMEFFQIPLAIRGQDRDALKAFARRNRPVTLGLGAATLLISLVPVVNSVLLTTSVAGAVLLRRRIAGEPVDGISVPPLLDGGGRPPGR
jgi:CysZ protein